MAAHRAAALAVIALGVVLRYVKASRAPITYDEAFSLMHFANLPWSEVFRDYHLPNNHILNTLILKAVATVSDKELALRLHSVAASALLLASCYGLARRACGAGVAVAVTVVLATHPFVVNYGALARGYGLGLGLLFGGMAWTFARLERSRRPAELWPCVLPLGLAASAVPTFAHADAAFFGALSLAVCVGAVSRWRCRSRLRSWLELVVVLFLPTAALTGLTYAWITKWPHGGFRWGYDDFVAALSALMDSIVQRHLEPTTAVWCACALWAIVLAWTARAVIRRELVQLVLGVTTCSIPLIFVVLHRAAGVKYPLDRTWIFIVPLLTIGLFAPLALVAEQLGGRARVSVLVAVTLGLVGYHASRLDLRRTPPWEHLVEVKPAMQRLRSVTHDARLCSRWNYNAAFEYYARRYKIHLRQSCRPIRGAYIFTSAADRAQYPAPAAGPILFQSDDGAYLLYQTSP